MRLSSFFVSVLLVSSVALAAFDEDQRKLENLLQTQQLPESVFDEGKGEASAPSAEVNRKPAIVGTATVEPVSSEEGEAIGTAELTDSVSVSPAESARPAGDTQ